MLDVAWQETLGPLLGTRGSWVCREGQVTGERGRLLHGFRTFETNRQPVLTRKLLLPKMRFSKGESFYFISSLLAFLNVFQEQTDILCVKHHRLFKESCN